MNVHNPRGLKSVRGKHSGIAGRKRQTNAFTLVEMLVVVSIILLVAVVALPGISSLSKSAARRSSVSLVMGALDAARAQAVSQSSNCFIVFANGDTALPENYRYRAFAIFQETYIPTAPTDPTPPYHLFMVRPWTLLPEGISFRPDVGATDGSTDGQTVFSAPKREIYCKPANQNVYLPFIGFNSIGAVDLTLSDETVPKKTAITTVQSRVKLFEGFISSSGAATTTNAAKSIADETINVSPFTGRAKREEVKIKESNASS